MKKQHIVNTILQTGTLFILMCAIEYFSGVEDWLMQTLLWVVPSGMGFFIGYERGHKDNQRKVHYTGR